MIARRDCQKVLLRRPFTGFAVWLAQPARSPSRHSERCAAARDPPRALGHPSQVSLRDMTLGGHAGPPRSRTKIHPTGVRNGIAHGN
jgi:hypothetical protein